MAKLPSKPDSLRDAVAEAIEAQRSFEEARPTRLGRGAERLTAPLGSVFGSVIPPAVVRRGVAAADRLAGATMPNGISGHDLTDIAACERAAVRVQGWAAGANAATGAASGFFGAAGLTVDIPATITLAVRNVRATGATYGFDGDSADERAFRLMVLEVATSQAGETRDESIAALNRMAVWLRSPEGRLVAEKGGEWLRDKVIERIARQLGFSLTGRGLGRVVPIVGGVVAASVNASFQTDVSRAARYAYRQRWLMARQLLPGPVAGEAPAPAEAPGS